MSGAPSAITNANRIDYLDGLRGVAILMVLALHYFTDVEQVPRSDFYDSTVLQYGYFGVQLFFIISGYVIFMTLEKTSGFQRFIVQRWIRLFPAMLAATALIVAVAYLMPYRSGGIPRFVDLLPGLTLAGANAISAITGVETAGLERGFWSLYVEFRYYVMFGLLFFALGRYRSFFALVALSLGMMVLMQMLTAIGSPYAGRVSSLCGKMLIGFYLPWFLLGMYVYLYRFERHRWLPVLLMGNALAYHLQEFGTIVMALCTPLLAFALFTIEPLQKIFRSRFLLFVGAISYPLYLINDSIGRGVIRTLYELGGGRVPFEILAIAMAALIMIPAWLIAAYIEPPLQRWLKRLLLKPAPAIAIPAVVPVKEA